MGGPGANLLDARRMLVRAVLCALPSIAVASAAVSPDQAPAGTVAETVIPDLGSRPVLPRGPVAIEPAIRGNPLWSVPLTSLSATRDRPVFSPSRRPPPLPVVAAPYVPPPPPPPAPPPPEPDRPLLTLSGTIAGRTGGVGIFTKQNDNAPVYLRIGEDYQGWVLRAVRGREATFERDNRTATLAVPVPEPPRTVEFGGRVSVRSGLVIAAPPTTDPNFWNR
jgi:hypothetical protein